MLMKSRSRSKSLSRLNANTTTLWASWVSLQSHPMPRVMIAVKELTKITSLEVHSTTKTTLLPKDSPTSTTNCSEVYTTPWSIETSRFSTSGKRDSTDPTSTPSRPKERRAIWSNGQRFFRSRTRETGNLSRIRKKRWMQLRSKGLQKSSICQLSRKTSKMKSSCSTKKLPSWMIRQTKEPIMLTLPTREELFILWNKRNWKTLGSKTTTKTRRESRLRDLWLTVRLWRSTWLWVCSTTNENNS